MIQEFSVLECQQVRGGFESSAAVDDVNPHRGGAVFGDLGSYDMSNASSRESSSNSGS